MTAARALAAAALAAGALAGCGLWGGAPAVRFGGRVLDAAGAPVAGAIVGDAAGRGSTLSQADGRFTLGLAGAEGGASLRVSKPGFRAATQRLTPELGGVWRLEADAGAGAPRVYLDPAFEGAALAPALDALVAEGAAARAAGLADADVAWLACPDARLDAAGYLRFARAGGRVWAFGEWGGYAVGGAEALNALSAPAGLRFTGATARQAGQDDPGAPLTVTPVLPPLGAGAAMTAFLATTVAYDAGALPLAALPEGAYAVLAASALPRTAARREAFAAAGAVGQGAVVAFGDTSGWRADDSLQDGTPNWKRGANLAWLAALLRF